MHGQILSCAEHHPYLGVAIVNDLSWNHHINNIAQSAHSSTNFLHINISKCSADTKQAGITGMVRPMLKYTSSTWDPHQQNQIQKLEWIQSKAARFVLNCYDPMASVAQMRQELGWPTLQSHRFTAIITMCYKAVLGLVHLPFPNYLTPKSRTMRGEHTHTSTLLYIPGLMFFKYSFFARNLKDNTVLEYSPSNSHRKTVCGFL